MNGLKYSVADWCFLRDEQPLEYYSRLKAAGFETAETVAPSRWAAARAAGINILNTDAPGRQQGLNKIENHPWLIPQIEESIQRAADNGILNLIVFSGERDGQQPSEGMENCATGFRTLAKSAESKGVVMVFEMVNSIDIPDYLAVSSAFGFELAKRVASPAFKVLYDVFHMAVMGEDVYADIAQNLDLIGHIHVSQIPGMCSPLVPGKIDYRKVVSIANTAGYKGYWGLEFHPEGDSTVELEAAHKLLNSYL